jgi:hypothetical protein
MKESLVIKPAAAEFVILVLVLAYRLLRTFVQLEDQEGEKLAAKPAPQMPAQICGDCT